MTCKKEFFCDMMREPLERINYKTCIKIINDDGTFKIHLLDLNDEFMMEYEKYLDTLVMLIHSLDHYTFLPFIARLCENGNDNVDGWFNGGIQLSNNRMIRFYIMKKDLGKFSTLLLGNMSRFWDYNGCSIIEGEDAYNEILRLNEHDDIIINDNSKKIIDNMYSIKYKYY